MSAELIYTDEHNFVWDKRVEGIVEFYQSNSIAAKPSDEQIKLAILDILEFEWQMFDNYMDELFGYSDMWIVETSQHHPIDDSIMNRYPYFFNSWEQLKSHMLDFDDYEWSAIYDIDGELLIKVQTSDVVFKHRIRRLTVAGQHRKIAKDLQTDISEVEKLEFARLLWEHYSALAYYLRFENGEDITFTRINGNKVTMEVRHHE